MVVQLELPTASFHFVRAKKGGWMLNLPRLLNHRSWHRYPFFTVLSRDHHAYSDKEIKPHVWRSGHGYDLLSACRWLQSITQK